MNVREPIKVYYGFKADILPLVTFLKETILGHVIFLSSKPNTALVHDKCQERFMKLSVNDE